MNETKQKKRGGGGQASARSELTVRQIRLKSCESANF